jgi:hypothetical protein
MLLYMLLDELLSMLFHCIRHLVVNIVRDVWKLCQTLMPPVWERMIKRTTPPLPKLGFAFLLIILLLLLSLLTA